MMIANMALQKSASNLKYICSFISCASKLRFEGFIDPKAIGICRFSSNNMGFIVELFKDDRSVKISNAREELTKKMSELVRELHVISDTQNVAKLLESKDYEFVGSCNDSSLMVELLHLLKSTPHVGLEVFNWRWKKAEAGALSQEEYSKGITLAGRVNNIDLAFALFSEASAKGLRNTSTYNALLGAYMYNGLTNEALLLFEDLKRDNSCSPTIVTYNVLLSIYGRSMLVDRMESVLQIIKEKGISPNFYTYNFLIAGYLTAWMWDEMEQVYESMLRGPIKPNIHTHILMLRGYSHSGNLEKMEETYELVRDYVNKDCAFLIRSMICTYCKSSHESRLVKIEKLLTILPPEEYKPWLNVVLIRLYAQENVLESMENYIYKALHQTMTITSVGVIRSILGCYFRTNALERLIYFVKQIELAGWRLCRSVYHCLMVMYGNQNHLEEMEDVLHVMGNLGYHPTKRTFMIMYKAYSSTGDRLKMERVIGTMFKHGYGNPSDALLS